MRSQVARRRRDPESRATGSATSTATTTPSASSRSTTSRRTSRAACISGQVLAAEEAARLPGVRQGCTPRRRSARRWSPPRAPAPPTYASRRTGASRRPHESASILAQGARERRARRELLRRSTPTARASLRARSPSAFDARRPALRHGQRRLLVRRAARRRRVPAPDHREAAAPCPAIALPPTSALLTAVGNDQDFAQVFVEQLELARGRATPCSGSRRSGKSANVIRALRRARELGAAARSASPAATAGRLPDVCDHCVRRAELVSIHRIQEVAHRAAAPPVGSGPRRRVGEDLMSS